MTPERIREVEREIVDAARDEPYWHPDEIAVAKVGPILSRFADEVREEGREARDRDLAAMIEAMDALESDADLDQRRLAFETLQDRFDGVSHEDHERAAAIRAKKGGRRAVRLIRCSACGYGPLHRPWGLEGEGVPRG